MIQIRPSEDRGHVDLGWLQSRHSFSFGSYHDPRHMGVSVLRVINDDRVRPGAGFDPHSHRDMEIISYVKRGTIEHQDSMGNVQRLPAGEFQLMSAGTGITHSEYNPSLDEPLEFLQIWVLPQRRGIAPRYQQKRFEAAPGLTRVIAPDGGDGALEIHQDASVLHLNLPGGCTARHQPAPGRTIYVHVIEGELAIDAERLRAGDGASVTEVDAITFESDGDAEALVFDLP